MKGRTLIIVGLASLAALARPGLAAPPSQAWESGAIGHIASDLRAIRPVGDGTFAATNPWVRVDARFDAAGARLDSDDGGVGVRFVGWGRAGAVQAVAPVVPDLGACSDERGVDGSCVRTLAYDHGDIVAWWHSRDGGLEQGWDVPARLPGAGPIELYVAIDGAEAALADDGDVDLVGEQSDWRVRGLEAFDARGEPLPAWFDVARGGLVVVVDDTDATYPIVIDPLLEPATTTLKPPTLESGYSYYQQFGIGSFGVGDINADGYDDVAVGMPYYYKYSGTSSGSVYTYTYTYDGRVFVYYGSSSGLATTAGATLKSEASSRCSNTQIYSSYRYDYGYGYFGQSITGGDINGDGYDDVVVGEPGNDSTCKGRINVFHGSKSGVATTASTKVDGPSSNGWLGGNVRGRFDVNGDGYDDVVASTRSYYYTSTSTSSTTTYGSRVYVYHGSKTGLATTATWSSVSTSTSTNYNPKVVPAGDVNGDGYDDLLYADPYLSSYAGKAYVYYGSSSGITTSGAVTLTGGSSYFGYSVAPAGDVNGDGYDDIAVGDPYYTTGTSYSAGRIMIFHGSASGIPSTVSQSLVGPGQYAYLGQPYELSNASYYYYDSTASTYYYANGYGYTESMGMWSVGDVDGDGYDEFAYGLDYYDYTASTTKYIVRMFRGSSSGLNTSTYQELSGSSPFGSYGVVPAGDVNGDGYADLMVPQPFTSNGNIVVYHGYDDDLDDDGSPSDEDCDDDDKTIYPGATDVTGDEIDSDCDGIEYCYGDLDGDGVRVDALVWSDDLDCGDEGEALATAPSGDCDDNDATRYPGSASEVVGDGADGDCDGVELCYVDADGDGFRTTATVESNDLDCTDKGEAYVGTPVGDCDDTDVTINPYATELLGDNVDSDCDGTEFCYVDADADGYRPAEGLIWSADLDCDDPGEANVDTRKGDCNDEDADYHPGATEVCGDREDLNCDGKVDYADADGDGFAACEDCDDKDLVANPAQVELCDLVDNDCDGAVDDDALDKETFYVDADGDGFTDEATALVACAPPEGYVRAINPFDCDDTSALARPGGEEVAGDGLDNDCLDGDEPLPVVEDKGCSTSPASSPSLLALGALVVLARRRPRSLA